MKDFNFEKNLPHQDQAVENTIRVFQNLQNQPATGLNAKHTNPTLDINSSQYVKNIRAIREENEIAEGEVCKNNVLDIMMETGTGKTYTYTKTIFKLNKQFGIFKFIIVVPTLSIKAGTINFLKSQGAREHFQQQYDGKIIKPHIVASQKAKRSKNNQLPSAVSSFILSEVFQRDSIQVLIINAGMINSDTMTKQFDQSFFDQYHSAFDGISMTCPFMIIDEPHKFSQSGKTWCNIQKMCPQVILRYGATFPEKEITISNGLGGKEKRKIKDYYNLLYTLNAVVAFNQNLVKGVVGYLTEFEDGKNISVKFVNSNGTEALFELTTGSKKSSHQLTKKDSLEIIHTEMRNLRVDKLNKTEVLLSNGLTLRKGDKINPFSYSETLQEKMLGEAIHKHFNIEKELLTQETKIKPLTLFFIDNIEEYRNPEGSTKKTFEQLLRAEIKKRLRTESDTFYQAHLQKALQDIPQLHGGYFSRDNAEKDEEIEKEINEILHDKQSILDIDNPRRFIFSKWTLREGWDNPNIFQICKLRSSGSEISKLQEVGRGLRLPVNEYGNRVKDSQFHLNYFVDFTENEFIDKLVLEINQKSGAISIEDTPEKLTDEMIKMICQKYEISEDKLLEKLDNENIIDRKNEFKTDGFEYIKEHYPSIFGGVGSNKIRSEKKSPQTVKIRTEKYVDLKNLWEKINQKAILQYQIQNEREFKNIFLAFLNQLTLRSQGIRDREQRLKIENNQATAYESSHPYQPVASISTLTYSNFLKQLSQEIQINRQTIHQSLGETTLNINQHLHQSTIRTIKEEFNKYLMYQCFSQFQISYQQIQSSVHPTKLTVSTGEIKSEINVADIGTLHSKKQQVAKSYLFDSLFYDSELEKDNIIKNIEEVIVFTKIPKNSIKIPIVGGASYSPDFAYVIKGKDDSQRLYFIVETKNTREDDLRTEEQQKIKHAEKFFGDAVKIQFKTQFSNQQINDLINKIYQ